MRRIAPVLRQFGSMLAIAVLVFYSEFGYGQATLRQPGVVGEQSGAILGGTSMGDDLGEPPVAEFGQPAVTPPTKFRLIRKAGGTATWLAGGVDEGLGVLELNTSATAIIPLMAFDAPLMITPSFGVSLLEAPAAVELPNELYRASAGVMWMKKPTDRLSVMLGITPGISSDFEATDGALRIFGYGAVTHQWTPTVLVTFGAAYTGRNDIPVFPMAGLIWTPYDDLRVEFSAPRPRVARRVDWLPWSDSCTKDWLYFAGELGGGTWAVERPSGLEDELTTRDFRLVLGYERTTQGGAQGRVEIGYVFGREIEFEDEPTEFEPSDTIMLRTALTF